MSTAQHASPDEVPAPVRLVPTEPVDTQALIDSYRGLADVFHEMLAEQSLDTLLEGIGYTLGRLLPHESIIIYEADVQNQILFPVLATGEYIEEVMSSRVQFGEGITGWAIEHREPVLTNRAHLDPRVKVVPGTPENEPEALVSIPLVARNAIKGALNIYRAGEEASFTEEEFDLAKRFADAAARDMHQDGWTHSFDKLGEMLAKQ